MNFLKRFFGLLKIVSKQPTSLVLPNLNSKTPLARFLKQSNHFSRKGGTVIVKQAAFIPPKDGKLSVSRIDGMKHNDICALGTQQLSPAKIYGWAEFPMQAVSDVGLQIINDNRPPRHCTIFGWPSKDIQKDIALQLANKSHPLFCESN